jgi:RHS repeat-associated protein
MTSRNGQVIQWNGDGKPSSIGNVAFTYDGVGDRLKKVSGGQTTRYIGGDYEISGGVVTKYLAGGKQVGTDFFIHHRDHLGSIQAISDATGAEVRRQDHKPFGDQHYAWGSHLESKGWIGEREEETELVHLNARYYDPEIGRFIAPDPIVRPGQGLNRYSYSWNNPINFFDPSGLGGQPPPPPDYSGCSQANLGACPGEVVNVFSGPDPTMPGLPANATSGLATGDGAFDKQQEQDTRDDIQALYDALVALLKGGDTTTAATAQSTNDDVDDSGTDDEDGSGSDTNDTGGAGTAEATADDCMTAFGCGSGQKLFQTLDYDLQIHTEAAVYTAGAGVVIGTGLGVGAGVAGGFGALADSTAGLAARGYRAGARVAARGYRTGAGFGRGVVSGAQIAYRGYSGFRATTASGRVGQLAGQFG